MRSRRQIISRCAISAEAASAMGSTRMLVIDLLLLEIACIVDWLDDLN